jgi:hypothetical protein
MSKHPLSPFEIEGKFCCSAFPEPLLKKFGWDSCVNCSIERLQPDGSRKIDNRRCFRSHGGASKGLIKIKVKCNQEANHHTVCGTINDGVSNKENSTVVAIPHTVTPSIGCNRKSITSERWWNDLRAKNSSMKDEIANLKREKLQWHVEKSRLEIENGLLLSEIRAGKEENMQLKNELFSCKAELMKATEQLGSYKGLPPIHKETNKESILLMVTAVLLHIMNIIMRKTQQVTRLRTLTQILFQRELFGSVATERVLREETKRYCRKILFVPWKVLQSLDLAINGGINYNGLESLRKLEGLHAYEQGCLPSRSSVQRCAAMLHELGQHYIPFQKVESQLGEMYAFNYEKMVRYILKAFSLDQIAQTESVELCITLDGAELTKDLCHLTFGVKVTDRRAIDPRDGSPLSYSEPGSVGNLFKVQSRNYCFVLKSLLGKDSKKAYQEFKDVFDFFDKIMKEGIDNNENGPRVMPLTIWSPQDLSSVWKCLNTGCGARKHGDKHWCHLCPCTGNKIAYYQVEENRLVIVIIFKMISIHFLLTIILFLY